MTDFTLTPTDMKYLNSILKDPITGAWIAPRMNFNLDIINPYQEIYEIDNDNQYRERIINYIYICLTEKWLYKEKVFESLLKFFNVKKTKSQGIICLINNLNDKIDLESNHKYKKYIFMYIEKFFITHNFVTTVLKNYVKNSNIKWYDICHNKNNLKGLFAYKLKKVIESMINKKKQVQQ